MYIFQSNPYFRCPDIDLAGGDQDVGRTDTKGTMSSRHVRFSCTHPRPVTRTSAPAVVVDGERVRTKRVFRRTQNVRETYRLWRQCRVCTAEFDVSERPVRTNEQHHPVGRHTDRLVSHRRRIVRLFTGRQERTRTTDIYICVVKRARYGEHPERLDAS